MSDDDFDTSSFAPGWLRAEIAAAVENFASQPYAPHETLTQMKDAVRALEESDRLRRRPEDRRSDRAVEVGTRLMNENESGPENSPTRALEQSLALVRISANKRRIDVQTQEALVSIIGFLQCLVDRERIRDREILTLKQRIFALEVNSSRRVHFDP